MNPSLIGARIPRDDGRDKVTGAALYVDDIDVPGMIYGATVRSPVARAKILSVDFDEGFDWEGIHIVRAKDLPGANSLPLLINDQRILARRKVRHKHEAIVLLACDDPDRLKEAKRHVHLRYQSRPMVAQIEDSLEAEIKVFGDDNIFKDIQITKGDVEATFARAAHVLEETFTTGHQEQLYIEPQGMIASWDESGLHLVGSLQCPYYVQKAMKAVFGLEDHQIQVVQATTGGGFGGKEEYPSMLAAHAALLAQKAQKPVKMIYDRAEDMSATTKRHPSEVSVKAATTESGVLEAVEIDVLLDGGAYCTLSPVVLSRAVLHALSAYRCDHVSIRGRVVATNTPPNGAFRGFGAPQTIFAMESMMDRIAHTTGLSPLEVRRRNCLRNGDSTATGQVLEGGVSASAVLERAAEAAQFDEKYREGQKTQTDGLRRGIGMALFMHGCGFTGNGERELKSRCAVELRLENNRPQAVLHVGTTDIGQGMRTTFRQIAAETLGFDLEQVILAKSDTSIVPDSGPTVASRTCMVVGGLVARCAQDVLAKVGLSAKSSEAEIKNVLASRGPVISNLEYEPPADVQWDEETYRGAAYATYGFGCTICEVEFDPTTYEVNIVDVVTCQDVGKAIHPAIVEGQIEGGTVQALGFGGYEKVVMHDGSMRNHDVSNYIIPTSVDIPPIRVLLHEEPFENGPFGAKGIGEMPMDGGAPAYVSAVSQAVGEVFRDLPVLPENIQEAVTKTLRRSRRQR